MAEKKKKVEPSFEEALTSLDSLVKGLEQGEAPLSELVESYEKGQALLCVSENGYGKRTYASEYRTTGRGGQGVINMSVTEKTGEVVATFPVTEDHQVMLVTDQKMQVYCRV